MVLLPYQPLLLTLFLAVPFHDWSVTGEKHAPANRRYLFIYFCLRVSFFFFLFYLGYFYSVTVGSETSGPSPHRRTAGVLSETCVFLCGFLSVCPSFSLSFFAFCFFFSVSSVALRSKGAASLDGETAMCLDRGRPRAIFRMQDGRGRRNYFARIFARRRVLV